MVTRTAPFASVFLVCVGCGGPGPVDAADIRVENEYAESLFSISYENHSGAGIEQVIAVDQRVEAFDSRTFGDVLRGADGDQLAVTFSAMSLGERRAFEPINVEMDTGNTLGIQYDYDLATAGFTIRYGWRY